MNAPVGTLQIAGDLDDFRECCDQHRWFLDCGILALPIAVDNLQWLAERWGLVDQYGQDNIQLEIARAMTGTIPAPLPIDEAPIVPDPPRRVYHTPQATTDAFWHVASLDDPDHLARWLADHKRDAPHLLKLWKAKQC